MALDPSPGTGRKEGAGFIVSYGAGRTCGAPSCATLLSRYNDSDWCWSHQPTRKRGQA